MSENDNNNTFREINLKEKHRNIAVVHPRCSRILDCFSRFSLFFLIIMEQSAFGIITASITIVVLLANKISQTSSSLVRYPNPPNTTISPKLKNNNHNKLKAIPIPNTTQARVTKMFFEPNNQIFDFLSKKHFVFIHFSKNCHKHHDFHNSSNDNSLRNFQTYDTSKFNQI